MTRQTPRYAKAALAVSVLFALGGCVSIAPIEPIKNPPTRFRSDNTVEVEFLHPIMVGPRCGERGTALYGVPVFHAMACGNGKLITMPDPCDTITGGAYADLVCELRARVADEPDIPELPDWQTLLQPASFAASGPAAPKGAKESSPSVRVEFVHPSAVYQRCETRGLETTVSSEDALPSCGNRTLLTMPNPCMMLTEGWYARTLCHEMAHANGWAMDHPGGSFQSDRLAGVDPQDVPPPREVLAALASSTAFRPASESPAYLAWAAARAPQASVPAVLLAAASPEPKVTLLSKPAPDLWQGLDVAPAAPRRHLALRGDLQFASVAANTVEARAITASLRLHAEQAASLPAPAAPTLPRQPDVWFAAVRTGREAYVSARDFVLAAWVSKSSNVDDALVIEVDGGAVQETTEPEAAPLPEPDAPRAPKLKPAIDRPRNDEVAAGV